MCNQNTHIKWSWIFQSLTLIGVILNPLLQLGHTSINDTLRRFCNLGITSHYKNLVQFQDNTSDVHLIENASSSTNLTCVSRVGVGLCSFTSWTGERRGRDNSLAQLSHGLAQFAAPYGGCVCFPGRRSSASSGAPRTPMGLSWPPALAHSQLLLPVGCPVPWPHLWAHFISSQSALPPLDSLALVPLVSCISLPLKIICPVKPGRGQIFLPMT